MPRRPGVFHGDMTIESQRPVVAVAGASGFVGRSLLPVLAADFKVIALRRSPAAELPGVRWRQCDLFSMLQTERALEGADYAVYLVHSMLPARLTQARFEDMDFILADNFARSAARAGVKQILYLGALFRTTLSCRATWPAGSRWSACWRPAGCRSPVCAPG